MTGPVVLRGVDRAAFAVALVARLRSGGVTVSASGSAGFVAALDHMAPASRSDLYWAARLTLVNRSDDLAGFDAVFDAVFGDAVFGLDPVGMTSSLGSAVASVPGVRGARGPTLDGSGLPWITRPTTITAALFAEFSDTDIAIPDALPSRLTARAEDAFETFDAEDLHVIGAWLERAIAHWPRRRSLRRETSRSGSRVDLRHTIRASRDTGWEAVRLVRSRRRRRPRRVVFLCDVSRSMQPYATIYLHLMRAAALQPRSGATIRPEVFAFSTALTRLTSVLSHRSAEIALERANAKVSDRYGGTHLGRSVAALLTAPHGSALRGAVVIIASDGWDADPPELLGQAMARLRRRAHRVIWLNPRASAPDYRPLAGSMAAALPYCDLFLPADTLSGIRDLLVAVDTARRGPPGRS
ncbi:VWA domain-containing protein [soil metagenome]